MLHARTGTVRAGPTILAIAATALCVISACNRDEKPRAGTGMKVALTVGDKQYTTTMGGQVQPPELDDVLTTGRFTSTHNWIIQWGIARGRLAFVAVSATDREPDQRSQPLQQLVNARREVGKPVRAVLVRPDGSNVPLPTEHQLFEMVNNHLVQAKGDVTLEELDAFLGADRADYTIAVLRDFVKRYRQSATTRLSPDTRPS